MSTDPLPPCVYCPSTIPPTKREHVMSQALGTFEQNWTLDCVCDECNSYFSRELELALGRDSVEGFLRIELGVKPVEAANKFLNKRMKATLSAPGYFDGAHVVMRPEDGTIHPFPPPQVVFRQAGKEPRFILERDLDKDTLKSLGEGDFAIQIIGQGDDLPRIVKRLAELNIHMQVTSKVTDQPLSHEGAKIAVHYDFKVDTTLRRAVAKIAFNYATKILGREKVRRPEFDAIRQFVRYGDEPLELVTAQRASILVGPDAATTKTHCLALGWMPERKVLISIISLFNYVTYGIRMCSSETKEYSLIQKRHFFDPISRTIREGDVGE